MTKKETIKDYYGRIIGFIETDTLGNKRVTDRYGRYLGSFNKRLNQTRDFYGKIIARGDNCGLLISRGRR